MIVYDLEVYQNLFLFVGYHTEKNKTIVVELSSRKWESDLLIDLAKYCFDQQLPLVGFNNLNYDGPMLEYIISLLLTSKLSNDKILSKVKSKSDDLVTSKSKYPPKYNLGIPQIDLMRINRFDVQMISLKYLMFALRVLNIQELPFHHTAILTNEEIDVVINYCKNDITTTIKLYETSKDKIDMRNQLNLEYDKNFITKDDAQLGEEIFLLELEKEMKCERNNFNKVEKGSTIVFKDLIFDYIKFESIEFNSLLNWLKKVETIEIKGCLNGLEYDSLKELEGMYNVKTVKGKQDYLNIIYKGYEIVYGVGGRDAFSYRNI